MSGRFSHLVWMKRVIKVDVMREMNLPLKLMLMKNL